METVVTIMQKIGVRMDYKDLGGNPFQEPNMITLRSIVAHVGIWKVKSHVIEFSAQKIILEPYAYMVTTNSMFYM